ncbi:MAG: 1-acyl-sn-glycerol-3-phosphate acyltransferase [Pseudomonadales bacterium]|nr:1-acyl-sn-glycerol-3-phosphate acyltransferase [Pseudomonadales bacterium]
MASQAPKCSAFAHFFGKLVIRLSGWKVTGEAPDARDMMIVAAPHTSNWDAILLLGAAYTLNLRINWLVKNNLFVPVLGSILRYFGGVPVERSRNTNMVQRLVDEISNGTGTALVVPPAGTRGYTDHWKSGFYRIALAADIPVVCGFLDYDKKIAGLGPSFRLTGNVTEDMDRLRAFYEPITGRYPALKSRIVLREELEELEGQESRDADKS